jgi:hypothetical protein
MDAGAEGHPPEIESLRGELERVEAERDRYREEVDRELVRRAFRINALENALYKSSWEFQNSLSWRVTKPLRSVKPLLGRLRGR